MDTVADKLAQVMIFLKGSKRSFRCACGCSVFTKISLDRYRCNVCERVYEKAA